MADWLDSADKVASVVGALAGVAALAITIRDRNRRTAPETATTWNAPDPPLRGEPVPAAEPGHGAQPGPAQGPVPPDGSVPPPVRRSAPRSGIAVAVLGYAVTVLAYCGGSALLGARLLSWIGGGSIGPWWLLSALTVSFMVGLFFAAEHGESRGVLVVYVLWLPVAAWLGARAFAYYWFPDLFGNQGVGFTVVFVIAVVIGVIGGFARHSASRR